MIKYVDAIVVAPSKINIKVVILNFLVFIINSKTITYDIKPPTKGNEPNDSNNKYR